MQDDDLVLELRQMPARATAVLFNLSSSVRAQRSERCPVPKAWYYLVCSCPIYGCANA